MNWHRHPAFMRCSLAPVSIKPWVSLDIHQRSTGNTGRGEMLKAGTVNGVRQTSLNYVSTLSHTPSSLSIGPCPLRGTRTWPRRECKLTMRGSNPFARFKVVISSLPRRSCLRFGLYVAWRWRCLVFPPRLLQSAFMGRTASVLMMHTLYNLHEQMDNEQRRCPT